MKKSLIALAALSAFAAPAFAATSNVDVYGKLSFAVDYADVDNGVAGADKSDLVTGVNHTSYIGFKGTEDLGGGMKAVWQVESEVGKLAATTDPVFANRNTFVGLAGGFGEVRLGRHDTPYKMATGGLDPFGDSVGDYNAIIGSYDGGAGKFDTRAAATVAYISPNFNGLTAAVAYIGVQNPETAGQDNKDAWSAAAMYDNGPLFASVAYEVYNGAAGAASTANKSHDAWKVGLGYKFGDTKVGVVYENIENDTAASATSRDAWYLSLAHTMGPMVLKAAYGKANESDANASDDATLWTVGVDYNMSKRTTLYAVYADLSQGTGGDYGMGDGGKLYTPATGKDASAFSVGIKHTF
ncbi:putative porin [Sulfuritortus calidifontis]|uniref:Putative porin n=1 Tax=Sulfuritortus calidifontis TaxID=1914471 RepID=A0A4R3JYB1_9PROT|nr:porin [Sulfuritortus calidifontis]TCS73464.1 putative porin [Sulfuritortus calidifontis]